MSSDLKALIDILTEKEIDQLRAGIVDLILKVIKEQLENSVYYIITPEDVSNVANEIITEKVEEIVDETFRANDSVIRTSILKKLGLEAEQMESVKTVCVVLDHEDVLYGVYPTVDKAVEGLVADGHTIQGDGSSTELSASNEYGHTYDIVEVEVG